MSTQLDPVAEATAAYERHRDHVRETTDLEALNDLAVLGHRLGRTEETEALLRATLAIDASHEDARANLAALGQWRRSPTIGGPDPGMYERAFPGMPRPDIMSEHTSRYAFALGHVGGRDVLDLGCGTGYGSEMLTWAARSVQGFDLWQPADHERPVWPGGARLSYGHDLCADPLPAADVATAFEVIEHLPDAPAALRIAWGSVNTLIASFPNPVYHGSWMNQFHVNDWTLEQFEHEVRAAAGPRGDALRLEHFHQALKSPLLTPGRDPESSYWVVIASAP
jgi:SAM-dependent methyltransferase